MELSRALRAGFVGAVVLALAGCGTFGDTSKEVACPVSGVLDKAGSLTRFADGAGRDLTDVLLQVSVTNIGTKCMLNEKSGVLSMDMRIDFRVERGPASQLAADRFTYFIAVADPAGNVTARQTFDKPVQFTGNLSAVDTNDEITTTIPIDRGQRIEDYRVYVALQLTQAELEYNRAYRGR